MRTGGELIVESLQAQGVERVFCVPGESFLAVLDALFENSIETIVARQEGGAAMMAEADGKMTGRPGICFVTRGPGAANASAGVHVAQQDSTPMIVFVGQIGQTMRGRDAFQEVDYRQFFGGMAKWVEEIDDINRIPEIISHAYHIALNGRPGPVVIALPEDMLRESTDAKPASLVQATEAAPSADMVNQLTTWLKAAKRPFLIVGGSRWDERAVDNLRHFAECWDLPVGCSFRRQHLFHNLHDHYAGDFGLGLNPALAKHFRQTDLLLLLGCRFSENPSQDFTLLNAPEPQMKLIHIHPGAEELGRIYRPTLSINATPGTFLDAMLKKNSTGIIHNITHKEQRARRIHADYRAWSDDIPNDPGKVTMGTVIEHMRSILPDNAIITNGAGNYASWLHRFYRYRHFGTQLAPTSGSMGYGLPSAIAAKLRYPDRDVICLAGDGCFQMTMQELGTAMQYGANIVILLADNGSYGTIRMHQEKRYPGRVSATDLINPDFAALADAYGAYHETIEQNADVPTAFAYARQIERPALLHLKMEKEAIAPGQTLTAIRERAK